MKQQLVMTNLEKNKVNLLTFKPLLFHHNVQAMAFLSIKPFITLGAPQEIVKFKQFKHKSNFVMQSPKALFGSL